MLESVLLWAKSLFLHGPSGLASQSSPSMTVFSSPIFLQPSGVTSQNTSHSVSK